MTFLYEYTVKEKKEECTINYLLHFVPVLGNTKCVLDAENKTIIICKVNELN